MSQLFAHVPSYLSRKDLDQFETGFESRKRFRGVDFRHWPTIRWTDVESQAFAVRVSERRMIRLARESPIFAGVWDLGWGMW